MELPHLFRQIVEAALVQHDVVGQCEPHQAASSVLKMSLVIGCEAPVSF